MIFAHPWMLLGIAGLLIPLFIHLFDRRRAKEVRFAALAFVLRSQKRTASRLKIRRLLIYALRSLMLLAIPIALAQPQIDSGESVSAPQSLAATAIVIDTSLATRWKRDANSADRLIDAIKDVAKASVQNLAAQEPATVVSCSTRASTPETLTFDRSKLIAAIDALEPGYGVASLNECLEIAVSSLRESTLIDRRLTIASPWTQSSLRFEQAAPTAVGPDGQRRPLQVTVQEIARDDEILDNRAIVDANAESAPELGPRSWQFIFTIRNFGTDPASGVELVLEVDGHPVAKSFVDIASSGVVQKILTHRFTDGGVHRVVGRLTPDHLPEDDSRHLVVSVPADMKALIVNGDPSVQKLRDEAFFVDAALTSAGSPVQVRLRDLDAAFREDLNQFDSIWLLNVPQPSAEQVTRLRAFVKSGGGLFLSMGNRVIADAWNQSFGDLLPRKLRVVKTAVEPGARDQNQRAARIQSLQLQHEILAPFSGRSNEGLLSTQFSQYMLFGDESAGMRTETLATLDDGAPALVVARHERGRIALFASTVDQDWCDLSIRTSFLPLIQRMASWLSGSLDEHFEVRAQVDSDVTLKFEHDATPNQIISPSGAEVAMIQDAAKLETIVGPIPEPGFYRVNDRQSHELPRQSFAAVIDPASSDLRRHKHDEVIRWFGTDSQVSIGTAHENHPTPIWSWLLLAAAIAFIFESALLRR